MMESTTGRVDQRALGDPCTASHTQSGTYDAVSRLLHWGIAVILVGMLGFGFFLEALPSGKDKVPLIQVHKSVGMVVAVFLLLRLVRRLRRGYPPFRHDEPATRRILVRTVHSLLLLLPLAMVASGVLRSLAYGRSVKIFGIDFIPALLDRNEALHATASTLHATAAWMLFALVALHATAALWHHFVQRDGTLRRMLPTLRRRAHRCP